MMYAEMELSWAFPQRIFFNGPDLRRNSIFDYRATARIRIVIEMLYIIQNPIKCPLKFNQQRLETYFSIIPSKH